MPCTRICKKSLEELKDIFNLRDWNISYKISRARKSDCLGCVEVESEYKRACITIYPEVIKRSGTDGETPFKVFVHEFAEIVMAENIGVLPYKQRFTPQMMEYRDRSADHLMRIVLNLLRQLNCPL